MMEVRTMRNSLRVLCAALAAAAFGGFLGGCSGGDTAQTQADPGPQGSGVNLAAVPPSAYPLPDENEAVRFLNQASFGANDAEIAKTRQYGYSAILEDQFFMPSPRTHEGYVNAVGASTLGDEHVMHTFWREAATGQDQLKRRVAFALSQIFVISLQDANLQNYRRGVASYLDMLTRNAFGNYRELLQDVTLHPMMGLYLSHLRNRKEDPATNRVPDQNYAREVMQLFSIGLYQLNPDGTLVLDGSGQPIETYGPNDIVGLSRVFTGFSWAGCSSTSTSCFNGSGTQSPNREVLPMQPFPQFHSTSEKSFLGTTIPASTASDPLGDLNRALDVIASHPNVGPFLGRQLIQRLVTSNPSPAYVGRVAQAFNTGRYQSGAYTVGSGQRGDLKATVAAILLDVEARTAPTGNPGKTREPVLTLAQWMRAFSARSASGNFLIGTTDNPANSLGQSPMRSPTVFNFYRPGYVPPNTAIAAASLVAPELQIVNEVSVVGYSNFMRSIVQSGVGSNSPRDVQPGYAAEIALAHDANLLVDRVSLLLTAGSMTAGTRNLIVTAVNSVPYPGSNEATARLNRARMAVFFTLSSPDYLVQK
ncbi:MAG TPA: DUF1800 domain-containing protein [Burkholderiales bacterium]|nr:DUF1800 domain-containing protein [Burkholderiales bacterium]